MPLGFHFPFSTIDAKALAELAQLLRDRGYGHVWTGENPGTNGFLPLALASQWAPGLGLASACFPVQTRGPGLFADTVAELCASAPESHVIVGIGSSSQWVVQRMNGRPYGRPVGSVRDMAVFLKAALAGEDVRADNASFRARYKLARPLARPPKLMVAALRPKMIEMGAAESDGVILNNVVPADLEKIVPLVKRHGAEKQIAARVYVTPVEDPTIVRQVGAASLAAYLGVPTYRKHQEWLGHTDLFAPLWKAWDQGGFAAARAAVTDTMVDHLYHHGSPEACRALIRDYEAAGVDHVIVSPVEEALDPREIARRLAPPVTTDASDEHFVPGRLCLFGEHSDWAAGYRRAHPEIARGVCVVAGTDSGVRVRSAPAEGALIVTSQLAGQLRCAPWQVPWQPAALGVAASSDHFLRYVAGAAAEFEARCGGRGAALSFTSDLPAQKGLSSSAAVCVATLRGLAALGDRSLSREEEMEWAYLGERRTGSACGRLDPIVAYGRVVSRVEFDGDDVAIGVAEVGAAIPLVVIDLGRSKDTPRILADLHRCYPDAPGESARAVRDALGAANQATVAEALEALAVGDLEALGRLMTEAQLRFDRDVVPASAALEAPHQQRVLAHPMLAELGFGAKGVGSQGDGCVQVVARDADAQAALVARLGDELGLSAFPMTVPATNPRPRPAPDESA